MGDDSLGGAGITAKERLERIEQAINDVANKLDVRFLSVESRIQKLETFAAVSKEREATVATDLAQANIKMEAAVERIQKNQLSVMRLVKYASAVLAGLVVATDALIRFFSR